jgi:hypothetical protein
MFDLNSSVLIDEGHMSMGSEHNHGDLKKKKSITTASFSDKGAATTTVTQVPDYGTSLATSIKINFVGLKLRDTYGKKKF